LEEEVYFAFEAGEGEGEFVNSFFFDHLALLIDGKAGVGA
jgi:hypothetical protein